MLTGMQWPYGVPLSEVPVMFDAYSLARPNIRDLKPYSSARDEFTGHADVFLDANENAFGSPIAANLNRYPDPLQRELKSAIAERYGVATDSIFVGNGSDEAIDLLVRVFCSPAADEIIVCPPTYGMYRVTADVNDVGLREVPLTPEFHLDADGIRGAVTTATKLIFICSPNNPTGNAFDREQILSIASDVNAIVIVDEAYGDFYEGPSLVGSVAHQPNLVVLRTLSKAYGLAAARVGLAFADPAIISLLNKAKPPYNVNELSQKAAIEAISQHGKVSAMTRQIRTERERLRAELPRLRIVQEVFPSDANFLLVRFTGPLEVYRELVRRGIVVRDRTREYGCADCLRITVGTPQENDRLLEALKEISAGGE